MIPIAPFGPPVERVRAAAALELERAVCLMQYLCDAVLAMGARRYVHTLIHEGVSVINVNQLGGYCLIPVLHAQRNTDANLYWVNGWRCDRVVRSPADPALSDDLAAGVIEVLPCVRCSTIEAAAAWVIGDIQRQWIAESLDDFLTDEYGKTYN